jgi:hypothetical protein
MEKPINIDLVYDAYEIWLHHPTTNQLIQNLQKLRKSFIDNIISNATNANAADSVIRFQTISLKNTEAILNMIQNYDAFKAQLTK